MVLAVTLLFVTTGRSSYDVPAGGDRGAASTSPRASSPPRAEARATAARSLLSRLQRRLTTGTARQVGALAAAGDAAAARRLRSLHRNVADLHLTRLGLRYAGLRDTGTAASRSWVVDVAVRWRLAGYDAGDSAVTVQLALRGDGPAAGFVAVRAGAGSPAPLWLLSRVAVDRTRRTLVIAAAPVRPRSWSRLADQAVGDVERVLPRWRGRLVVEVPTGRRQLTQVLGSATDAYRGTAAVTTTADRSDDTTTADRSDDSSVPVHVYVNRDAFGVLGVQGSQIVLSHEATHVATGAAFSSAPEWLVEGFADYVALRDVDIPVRATAGQALARVSRDGPPARLPGPTEFGAEDDRLGSAYEAAWLACRLLARTYDERRLVRFYRAADRLSSTAEPFRTVLGTDQATFTRAWRAELRRLAT